MSTQSKEQQQIGFLSLCYHYIRPDNDDPFSRLMGTKITEFKNQIKMLKEKFEMISLDDVLEFINTKIFDDLYNPLLDVNEDTTSSVTDAYDIIRQMLPALTTDNYTYTIENSFFSGMEIHIVAVVYIIILLQKIYKHG